MRFRPEVKAELMSNDDKKTPRPRGGPHKTELTKAEKLALDIVEDRPTEHGRLTAIAEVFHEFGLLPHSREAAIKRLQRAKARRKKKTPSK